MSSHVAYEALVATLKAAADRDEVCPVGTLIQAIEDNLPQTLPCQARYSIHIYFLISTLVHVLTHYYRFYWCPFCFDALNECREEELENKKQAAERGLLRQYVNKMTFKAGGIQKGAPGT